MMGTQQQQPRTTRRQRQYIRYVVIAILLLVVVWNWRSEVDTVDALSPYTIEVHHKNKDAATSKEANADDDTEDHMAGKEDSTADHGKSIVPAEQAKPKIAIVTFTTSEKSWTYLSLKNKYGYANKHDFTMVMDYEAPEQRNIGIMWHKFTMIERIVAAGTHDWIWWIDFDTLITNHDIRLDDIVNESLHANVTSVFPKAEKEGWMTQFKAADAAGKIPDEVDFLLTADCFPLNAGSMLVRGRLPAGSSRQDPLTTAPFLERVRKWHKDKATDENQMSEQDCIRDLLEADKEYANKHVHFIPQWKMNAFPEEIRCWDKDQRGWEEGSFAIHFAGAWAHVKGDDPTGQLMRKWEGKIQGYTADQ